MGKAVTMSWEAMLPMGIISAMIFVMGMSQYVIDTSIYGKPKHPKHGVWDRTMDKRDARLKEYAKSHVGNAKALQPHALGYSEWKSSSTQEWRFLESKV